MRFACATLGALCCADASAFQGAPVLYFGTM
jgi:hypothetical protein